MAKIPEYPNKKNKIETITIQKSMYLKRELEKDIHELLIAFKKQTILTPNSINIKCGNGGYHEHGFIVDVNVEVKL